MLPEETLWPKDLIELERKEWTLGRLLEEKARKNKGKTFLLFENERITFDQFNERANRVANSLLNLGIRKGDKVAIMLPNCPDYLYLWFGIAKMGAVMVPINVSWKGELLNYILNHSDSETLVVEESLFPQIEEILGTCPRVQRIFIRSGGSVPLKESYHHLEKLFEASSDEPQISLTRYDPFEIMYTSGTTGRSKGVVRWSEYLILRGLRTVQYMGYTGEDTLYTCLPLYHGNAQNLTAMPALLANARLALGKRFSASNFWNDIRRYGASVFNFVGTMIAILYKQEPKGNDADNPVRLARGGNIPPKIWKDFESRFGLTLVETYGTTEGGSIWNMPGGKIGSIGKPPYFNEARIVDEADQELPQGKIGELIIRPRDPEEKWVEYYKEPEATQDKIRGGWFRTGDLAYRDEEGWFFFVGRKKDAIRRRGENISASEVELVIMSHPKVLECACFGVPSELGEDDVMACIVARTGMSLSPQEILSFCEKRMAYFMIPRYLEFVESLPKTPTERIEKYKLKATRPNENTWDREKSEFVTLQNA
jgi:crotonobetaine/carnitine-CoA ligase